MTTDISSQELIQTIYIYKALFEIYLLKLTTSGYRQPHGFNLNITVNNNKEKL